MWCVGEECIGIKCGSSFKCHPDFKQSGWVFFGIAQANTEPGLGLGVIGLQAPSLSQK